MSPLFTKDALIDRLWLDADCSTECVRSQIQAAIKLLQRTNNELGFSLHHHHVDPDHIPPVGVLLPELEEALNKSEEDKTLRWLDTQPMGKLVGFRRRSC